LPVFFLSFSRIPIFIIYRNFLCKQFWQLIQGLYPYASTAPVGPTSYRKGNKLNGLCLGIIFIQGKKPSSGRNGIGHQKKV